VTGGKTRFDHTAKYATFPKLSANSYVKTSAVRAVSSAGFFYHTFSAQEFACAAFGSDANSRERGISPGNAVPTKENAMLKWALLFALISLVAGLLGFTGIAAGAAGIAKILFVLFLVLFVIFLLLGLTIAKKIVD
jgi:uncharacterized membrane protein YtjA (UPF0391 family)